MDWPVRRRRILCAAINTAKLQWMGPPVEEVQQEFDALFNKATMLPGSALFFASDSERHEEYAKVGRLRHHNLTAAEVPMMNKQSLLQSLVPPGSIQRMKEWIQCREDSFCLNLNM